jgi:hypothetical protein
MTYGVDQCRICGKPIRPSGPESMSKYVESLQKKPTMSEKEWRAAGFKAAPTPFQMRKRRDGCCFECQFTQGMGTVSPLSYKVPIAIGIVALFVFFFCVASLFT